MFERETTFILGAGASLQYGYPTGQELINRIIKAIDNDDFTMPTWVHPGDVPRWNRFYINENEIKLEFLKNFFTLSLDTSFHEHAHLLPINLLFNLSYSDSDTYGTDLSPNIMFINFRRWPVDSIYGKLIKLSNIGALKKLSEELKKAYPLSIDKFLRDYPAHAIAGKLMIAYEMLKCENLCFFEGGQTAFKHGNPDHWYRLLLEYILENCHSSEELFKVNIITFNYDVSLDHYLRVGLSRNKIFSPTIIDDFLKRVHHVYGKLHNENENEKNLLHDFSGYGFQDKLQNMNPLLNDNSNVSIAIKNMIRLFNAYRLQDNIQVIYDEKQKLASQDLKEILESTLQKTQDLFIIGFGFDKENLNLLKLQERLSVGQICNIFLHDHLGNRKLLCQDFCNLIKTKLTGAEFHPSITDRIEDAWSNDFMTRLIEYSSSPIAAPQTEKS